MITWIIGSGGLLGRTLTQHSQARVHTTTIPWQDHDQSLAALRHHARNFQSITANEQWRVIWAAGAATTSTPRKDAWREFDALDTLLASLRKSLPKGKGSFFLASSAGGVYAGSESPPFTETSATRPLSAYGEVKIAQESLVTDVLCELIPTAVGRISNLYGPGQDLAKLQGLISRLVLAAVTKNPIPIFVPLSTLRDYLYVDDAAHIIVSWLREVEDHGENGGRTVVISSGAPSSVAALIHLTESVTRVKIPIALGTHSSSQAQAYDLRLTPTPLAGDQSQPVTSLPAGIRNVYLDVLSRFQAGVLAS